ncbi:hypothetical protein U1Q18_041804 [Sarracenia purpurea var. burkii]
MGGVVLDEGCTDLKRCGRAVRNARRSSRKVGRRHRLIPDSVVFGKSWITWGLNSPAGDGPNSAISKAGFES